LTATLISYELQTSLDLADLAEAQEDAFFSPLARAVDDDNMSALFSDSDSISRLSVLSSSPLDNQSTHRAIQRPNSFSSRMQGAMSHLPPASTSPSLSSNMQFNTSPNRNQSATATTSPRSTSIKSGTRPRRSNSLMSATSSAVSTNESSTGASGKDDGKSIGSAKDSRASTYGDWIGWRSWRRSEKKVETESIRTQEESVDGVNGQEISPEGSVIEAKTPTPATNYFNEDTITRNRVRSQSNATTSSVESDPSFVSPAPLSRRSTVLIPTTSPPPSRLLSLPSESKPVITAVESMAVKPISTSSSKASSINVPSAIISRSRGSTMSLFISPHATLVSPSLSTVASTSALLPHQRIQDSSKTATLTRIKKPSHYGAIRAAAAYWTGDPHSVFVRSEDKIGGKIRSLVDSLMGNVAAAVKEAKENQLSTPTSPVISTVSPSPSAISIPLAFATSASSSSVHLAPPVARSYVSSAKGSLGRALGLGASASSSLAATMNRSPSDNLRRVSTALEPNLTMFPKLSSLSKYSPFAQPALATPLTTTLLSATSASSYSAMSTPMSAQYSNNLPSTPATMELDTISAEAKPPTLASLHNHLELNQTLSSDHDGERPLVDRYGFVYDVASGMKLLREARKRKERVMRGSVSSDEDDTDGRKDALNKSPPSVEGEGALSGDNGQTRGDIDAEFEDLREALGLPPSPIMLRSSFLGPINSGNDNNVPTLSSVSTLGRSTRLARSLSAEMTPAPSSPGGVRSMKRLLAQLTEMHDALDATQKEAWDSFIKRRQRTLHSRSVIPLDNNHTSGSGGSHNSSVRRNDTKRNSSVGAMLGERAVSDTDDLAWSENLVGVAQMGLAGKKGKDDWIEFKELVRRGVPIAYRPRIWAECSGATEAREPGVYQDLLSKHEGEVNQCLIQIDLDCASCHYLFTVDHC
jgi:hypothetical protein